jgi:hypothetical protein
MASIRPMQCDSVPDSSLRDRPPAPEGELNGSGLAIAVWTIAHSVHLPNAMGLGT